MQFYSNILAILIMLATLVLAGCAKIEFANRPSQEAIDSAPQAKPYVAEYSFPYSPVTDFFKQDQYENNHTSVSFEVVDQRGQSVPNLSEQDFEPSEDSQAVDRFSISSSLQNLGQKADIVFVFDVTNSMQDTINTAKSRVQQFVEDLQKKNIEAALCLVTFRDQTESRCDRMVEDNPSTPENENLNHFLAELSQLRARGGGDTDENQLRAIMDAGLYTPWRVNSQRIAVLVTDAPFHYAPQNKGDAGELAPKYEEALQVVSNAGMMVFPIAPKKSGYNGPFKGQPALFQVIGGEYFSYSDMVEGKVSMQEIFKKISDRISTYYTLSYVVEDQTQKIDPKKPLNKRSIKVNVKNSSLRVRILSNRSNWPNGKPQLRTKWKLSKVPRSGFPNLHIKVNGGLWPNSVDLVNGEVRFQDIPPQGGQIEVTYDTDHILDGMTLKPLIIPANISPETIIVSLNGFALRLEELGLSTDLEGRYVFDPFVVVNRFEDPFEIYKRRGLHVLIEGLAIERP